MSRIVQFMRDLVAKGMSWDDAAEFASRFEESIDTAVAEAVANARPARSAGAERQARFRAARAAEQSGNVTGDVTPSVTPLSEGAQGSPKPLPNPPNLSQEPPIVPQKSGKKAKLGPAKGAFARFWAEYPSKVGKLACEKAYPKARTRQFEENPDDDPDEAILAGLRGCMERWAPEFIPNPLTFLNQGRWMDQPKDDLPDSTGPPRLDLAKIDADRARIRAMYETEDHAA
jgi:hypothetical protein